MNPDAIQTFLVMRRYDFEGEARIHRTTKGTRRPGLRIRRRLAK